VDVPGVPPSDRPVVPCPNPPNRPGFGVVASFCAVPKPAKPVGAGVAEVSGGFGVVDTLAGALAKENGLDSAGLSVDVVVVLPRPAD